jgi:type 1 glutamine amidotransferase
VGEPTVRNLIVSGGVGHPFDETSEIVAELFATEGIDSQITTDIDGALASLCDGDGVDVVTVNALRWRMGAERYAPQRAEWAFELSDAARAGVRAHLDAGRGLVGIHTASICFDDWPEWGEMLGGRWDWDRSSHPPLGPARVQLAAPGDALVADLDDFDTYDEIYGFLDLQPDIEPILTSEHGGVAHPVMWRRMFGQSRVVYDGLGHDRRGFDSVAHRTLLRRAARWVVRQE